MKTEVVLFLPILMIELSFGDPRIVHLFEWRFDDVADECEHFLGPKGYTAVQVSPVNEHVVLEGRPWYERYQPYSYEIFTRSGDEDQFEEMCRRCLAAGVEIYVDAVFNHMSANQPVGTKGTAKSDADTKNKNYPSVPYNKKNFHSTCSLDDYQNAKNVRNCELLSLHDLNHTQSYVQEKIVTFLNRLIKLGASGFRIDAAKHMWPNDLRSIYSRLRETISGKRPFIYQEVYDFGGEAVKREEYTPLGHVTEFRNGKELSRCFKGQNPLKWLRNYGEGWALMPSNRALVFIDNHDSQRTDAVLNYKNAREYKMATGFMLGWGHGTPKIMSSYNFTNNEEGPPHNNDMSIKRVEFNMFGSCTNGRVCEHRWTAIYGMVGFAKAVEGNPPKNFWSNGNNQISFCRGRKGFAAFNVESFPLNQKLNTCLPEGTYCDVASGFRNGDSCSGKSVMVDADGAALITIDDKGEGFLAIHLESRL